MSAKRTYFQAEADAPTGSMEDVYEAGRPRMSQYLQHIRMQPGQVGLACAIDGDTAGIELIRKLWDMAASLCTTTWSLD